MFIILSGSSGVGKNTIIKELQKNDNSFAFMPTFTTREMRSGERDGFPYYFITKDEFQNKIKENEFLEYEFIHGNYYGSSSIIFEQYLKNGQRIIKDIGVQGAKNLEIKVGDKTDIIKIFLTVKHKMELQKRLTDRGEKQVKLRLKRFCYEQKQTKYFDFIIYNESLEQTISVLNQILNLKIVDYVPCKKLNYICKYKVKYYINRLNAGKALKPIKITLQQNKAYITSGVERFVASVLAKKSVAKIIVDKKIKKKIDVPQNWYKNII